MIRLTGLSISLFFFGAAMWFLNHLVAVSGVIR